MRGKRSLDVCGVCSVCVLSRPILSPLTKKNGQISLHSSLTLYRLNTIHLSCVCVCLCVKEMYQSYHQKEDQERESRQVNHSFLIEVYVWYSPTIEKKDGYGIYLTKSGKLLKGTTHTEKWGNPYPRDLKDVEIIGRAVALKEAVDIPKSNHHYTKTALPEGLSIEKTCMCDLISLSSLLFEELLSFSGMAHED